MRKEKESAIGPELSDICVEHQRAYKGMPHDDTIRELEAALMGEDVATNKKSVRTWDMKTVALPGGKMQEGLITSCVRLLQVCLKTAIDLEKEGDCMHEHFLYHHSAQCPACAHRGGGVGWRAIEWFGN